MNVAKLCFVGILVLPSFLFAQRKAKFVSPVLKEPTVLVSGKVFDKKTDNLLPEATIVVYDTKTLEPIGRTYTDIDGRFALMVPEAKGYKVVAGKPTYYKNDVLLTEGKGPFAVEINLKHKPGYLFDITIFDKAIEHLPINTLRGCKVEIYNNTTKEQELTILNLDRSTFAFPFNEGNHYTVLVRQKGYLNRRIEVYVNVNDCILCVDGMGIEEPDVIPLMNHGNETGNFLGSIDLDSIRIGKKFEIENIYYAFNKSEIQKNAAQTLDKLGTFLKDNPQIKVELGSHTDSRGPESYNLALSESRAKAAVDYLIEKHGIHSDAITSKGYGESQLANNCKDGVSCSEKEHYRNRRTEITITGTLAEDPLWNRSLKEIIEDPDLYQKIIKENKEDAKRRKLSK